MMLAASAARAQFAVIDVGAIAQLISQARTLSQQLSTARDHLAQAQAQFQSMTGTRGMERLLSGTVRNYLPSDWAQLQNMLQNINGGYGALSASLQAAVAANAVLSAAQLQALSPPGRQQMDAQRNATALLQTLAGNALANTSGRFASLQQLIDAIPAAVDQKGILELQARIGAEQTMLENEQSKLQVLYQLAQAQDWANRQRAREQIVAGHGQFADRFQPEF
jgi:type IV secretion system protein VirB5